MQPKVSMVIPCYNKEKYIANMFDSVLAQEWDNIEVILVNDGSTDRTREIIAEYETKFLACGYEVVIVDQENRGLPGAVYSGLLRITGEFVCQVDADDELDPRYVSIMAGWLWENPEYEWAACDTSVLWNELSSYQKSFVDEKDVFTIEKFILSKIQRSVCIYMIRSSYLANCGVINTFYTGREASQEASMYIPLALHGGKFKYFRMPLYKYNMPIGINAIHHRSYTPDHISYKEKWKGYVEAFTILINRIPIVEMKKKRYIAISEINGYGRILTDSFMCESESYVEEAFNSFVEKARKYLNPFTAAKVDRAWHKEDAFFLTTAVEDNILNIKPSTINIGTPSRIIAWGVLGKYGSSFVNYLKETTLEPTEMWDVKGDDHIIKRPNVHSLSENDVVLILTKNKSNTAGIAAELSKVGCKIITTEEISTYMASLRFPQFYDGSIKFIC